MNRHILPILALPFTVTIVIPSALLYFSRGTVAIPGDVSDPVRLATALSGASLILCGVFLLFMCIRLFGKFGDGTLAPWNPPTKFVAVGIYRHVRNPMISGVFFILLGEAMLFLSPFVAGWFLFFVTAKLIYISKEEEPELIERFGEDYRVYQQNVPAWIPRFSPYVAPVQQRSSGM